MQRPNPASSKPADTVAAHLNLLTGQIIACALDVHGELGPGLFEKAYERALCIALSTRNVQFLRQVPCPVTCRGEVVGTYRCDLVVEGLVVVEVKCVERLDRLHVAQVLTYLRATGTTVGLIINFNVAKLREGIKRVIRS